MTANDLGITEAMIEMGRHCYMNVLRVSQTVQQDSTCLYRANKSRKIRRQFQPPQKLRRINNNARGMLNLISN